MLDRHAQRRGDLRPPEGKAEGHAPGMSGQGKDKPAQDGDDDGPGDQPPRHRFTTAARQPEEPATRQCDQRQIDAGSGQCIAGNANRHLAKRAPFKGGRQKKGSEKRAEYEEGKRHHHPARPAAKAEQDARSTAIRKLHADAEDERADDQRDRYRRHRTGGS